MAWSNKGLSLIGTLVAVVILALVVVVASRLTARTQQAARLSRENFAAATAAREGLELVRAMRDTNWFLQRSDNRHWTHGLCTNPDTGETFDERQFTLDARTVRRLNPVGDSETSLLTIGSSGEWTHHAEGKPTPYHRVLAVDCRDRDVSIVVTARVSWPSNAGLERTLILSERLYDWFQ